MVSARTFWVGMIVGLLSLSVGVNLYVLFTFAESPSLSLEENWEAKSKNWNQFQAQNTINRKLGWRLDVLEDAPAGSDPTTFEMVLQDADRLPIHGAAITLKASHNAHYGERQLLRAIEFDPGKYRFEIMIPYSGLWQFDAQVQVAGPEGSGENTFFTQAWTEKLVSPAAQ
ncbi:MAG: hypothetical protein GY930_19915 [bacterium]|nr:hypothetical protein [bacterium]